MRIETWLSSTDRLANEGELLQVPGRVDWVLDQVGVGKRVLDIGCRGGSLSRKVLDRNNQVWGLEPHPAAALAAFRERVLRRRSCRRKPRNGLRHQGVPARVLPCPRSARGVAIFGDEFEPPGKSDSHASGADSPGGRRVSGGPWWGAYPSLQRSESARALQGDRVEDREREKPPGSAVKRGVARSLLDAAFPPHPGPWGASPRQGPENHAELTALPLLTSFAHFLCSLPLLKSSAGRRAETCSMLLNSTHCRS